MRPTLARYHPTGRPCGLTSGHGRVSAARHYATLDVMGTLDLLRSQEDGTQVRAEATPPPIVVRTRKPRQRVEAVVRESIDTRL